MSNNTKIHIHPELRKAVEEDNLVLFIGAGLSYNFKNKAGEELKGWNNLVKSIKSFLKGKGKEEVTENEERWFNLDSLSVDKEPIYVLDWIEKENKKYLDNKIKGFVSDFFALSDDNDFSLYKKLFELSDIIVTTNYDDAIKKANIGLDYIEAYRKKDRELAMHRKKGTKLLFKLHGSIDDPESMIVLPSDYEDLYEGKSRESKHVLFTLQNIIYNKIVLFIGTGMGDHQINNMFAKIKEILDVSNQKHFIISKETPDSKLDFLTHIPISDHKEIPSYIDELIDIKREKERADPMYVLKSKKANEKIKELSDKIEIETDENKKKDLLLEREAERCYNRGSAFYKLKEYNEAIDEFKNATELVSDSYKVFFGWGGSLLELANISKSSVDKIRLYENAIKRFEQAISINPKDYYSYINCGASLNFLADISESFLDKSVFYGKAIYKFEKATSIESKDYYSYYNWGVSLLKKADFSVGSYDERKRLYELSINKFEKAININPNYSFCYSGCGLALLSLAKLSLSSSSEQKRLLELSVKEFEKAVCVNSEGCFPYNNWGVSLIGLADLSDSLDDKERYYKEAIGKFEIAVSLNPEDFSPYNNWGLSLVRLADTCDSSTEKKKLYDEAYEKFILSSEKGGEVYDISTLFLDVDFEKALYFLDKSLSSGEVDVDKVEKDEEWKEYLDEKELKEVLDRYRK